MSESAEGNTAIQSKEFNESSANVSQTETSKEMHAGKRPRGRPKASKSDSAGDASKEKSWRELSLNTERQCRKRGRSDIGYISTPEERSVKSSVEKRGRGRPRLSTTTNELPEVANKNDECKTNAITNSDAKRPKGRPKGSRNKIKRRRSDDFVTSIVNQNPNLYLVTRSKRSSDIQRDNVHGSDPQMPEEPLQSETPIPTQEQDLNNDSLPSSNSEPIAQNTSKPHRIGRPPGAKNKPKPVWAKVRPVPLKISNETIAILRKKNKTSENVAQPLYKSANIRDIPKKYFDEAYCMIKDAEHPIWRERNISCKKSIHRHWDEYVMAASGHTLRLKFARQFLLRRDWISLSKVLSISLQDVVINCNSYYSLFSKYAAICLAHTDKQQFNKFLQFLFKTEADGEKILEKCSQFGQNDIDGED